VKLSPFLVAIPLIFLGGSIAPNQNRLDPRLLTGNISLTLKHGVWKLWAEKPTYQNLTLDLSCDRGNCQPTVWGYAPKFNKEVDHQGTVIATNLQNAWRLQVKMKIQSHPWSDEVREGFYHIEVVPYQGQLLGSFTGTLGQRTLQNKVNGTISPAWPVPVAHHQPLKPLEHPRLIFRASELENLRKKAKTPIGQKILAQLNHSLQQKIYYDSYIPNGGYHATGYCFLALLQQNPQAAATAWQIIAKSRANPGRRSLEQAAIVAGVALAYDLCYNLWTKDRRQELTAWLSSEGKKLLKGGSPRDGWNGDPASNWNARARGAAGLAALALLDEPIPEDSLYSPASAVEMAKRQLARYFLQAIGDRGFGTEGDHYTTEPMIISVFPFLQAYQNVIGKDFVGGSRAATIIPHYLSRVVPKQGTLAIPAYGRHNSYMGTSLFTMAWRLIPKTALGAVKWRVEGQENSLFEVNFPQIAPFILAGYPEDIAPANPIQILDRVLADQQKGFYVFRDRWQDENDFVASLYLKRQPFAGGWSFPDVGSVRIWGLGGTWATFLDSTGERAGENVLILPKSPPWQTSEPIAFHHAANGSGVVTLKTDNILIKGANPPSGVHALRSFAVDYSGASGSPGLFVLMDSLIGNVDEPAFRGRTWVMNTEGSVTIDGDRFSIANANGATMQGTFISPSSVRLRFQKTAKGGRILATAEEDFFVVMTVQKGAPPPVRVTGTGLSARVKVGKQEISIDNGTIGLKIF
jgi:hypothetical protein